MIDQKFDVVFQISQLPNVPQKCFSAQNGPLDVRFQMRLNPNLVSFFTFGKIQQKPRHNLLNCFEIFHHGFCLVSSDIRSLICWGLSHLKTDIERCILNTEIFFRDISGLRYLTNICELLTNN